MTLLFSEQFKFQRISAHHNLTWNVLKSLAPYTYVQTCLIVNPFIHTTVYLDAFIFTRNIFGVITLREFVAKQGMYLGSFLYNDIPCLHGPNMCQHRKAQIGCESKH